MTTMKTIIRLTIVCLFLTTLSNLWFAACASQKTAEPAYSENSLALDAAIAEAAAYFTGRLPLGAKTALVPFTSPSGRLSDYVFEEMWSRFEDSGRFVMVDRRNLERIDAEIKLQYETGRVDDEPA